MSVEYAHTRNPERKSSFFQSNSILAVKVVGRNGKTPGTVSVNGDGDTNVGDLSSMTTDETSEMHHLYATVTYQETFNKHVWRSIGVCLKDRVFPKVKFWKDTKANFIMPDFVQICRKINTNSQEKFARC